MHHSKVIILGSGPAGYSAAIYTARASLNPLIISGSQPGGQLTITTDVENYPGFADPIQGPWLMDQMKMQAINCGAHEVDDHISHVDFSSRPFRLTAESGNEYSCDALIITTGASANWLGLKSEEKFKGFGVSGCATCDGPLYKKKTVMVIGGGNTAAEEALYLSKHAAKVILIHRKEALKAEKILQERVFSNAKISILWNRELVEVLGTEDPLSVNGALIRDTKSGKEEKLDLDGIFVAIGHSPNTTIFKDKIEMDIHGYIVTNNTKTNIHGVFAAGDVQDRIYRQAVTAAGTGCIAALEVERYLS
ncbi:Thioredoxin reductase [Candidatus Cyrtobacter comes]|uniref:Thioredoxin reductase n=1 Tax=Candidatus Cyrtobacter comes TaxID=675776 RepID=A0ABU5L8X5_9RICK|nr:thioredoxin-disulfide reductase [Candidatus Cyrtobacter comes]MDZ5762574.1 Thioredoxin reductase [Candidatus Cyrtobacter comes]